jgi:hypothetical protein
LPDSWPLADVPQREPIVIRLPDQRPVTPAPASKPRAIVRPSLETFEVLAYRMPTPLEESAAAELPSAPVSMIVSAPEPSPPAPKHIAVRRHRQRFTWESPEMYQD